MADITMRIFSESYFLRIAGSFRMRDTESTLAPPNLKIFIFAGFQRRKDNMLQDRNNYVKKKIPFTVFTIPLYIISELQKL